MIDIGSSDSEESLRFREDSSPNSNSNVVSPSATDVDNSGSDSQGRHRVQTGTKKITRMMVLNAARELAMANLELGLETRFLPPEMLVDIAKPEDYVIGKRAPSPPSPAPSATDVQSKVVDPPHGMPSQDEIQTYYQSLVAQKSTRRRPREQINQSKAQDMLTDISKSKKVEDMLTDIDSLFSNESDKRFFIASYIKDVTGEGNSIRRANDVTITVDNERDDFSDITDISWASNFRMPQIPRRSLGRRIRNYLVWKKRRLVVRFHFLVIRVRSAITAVLQAADTLMRF